MKQKNIYKQSILVLIILLLLNLAACEIPVPTNAEGSKSQSTSIAGQNKTFPEITMPAQLTSAVNTEDAETAKNSETSETTGKWSNPNVRIVEVEITKVSDGDTIRATVDGKNQRVRLIGIDSPEIAHPEDGIVEEFYGEEAFAYSKKMLEGKTVYLSFDEEMYDQYDRILAYLWFENPKGNEEDFSFAKKYQFNCHLLEYGYARYVRIPPNLTFARVHNEVADAAKDAKIGMWAEP